MSDGNHLYSLLQIGTSRAGSAKPTALPAELEVLVPDGGEAEAKLWLSLGAWSLWARAGLRPADNPAAAPLAAAPAESLRACPPRAEALLARLLQSGQKTVLPLEWLRELKRYGGYLPARFLPNLLTFATRHPELRTDLTAVLGERGRWLSRFDSAWAWAVPATGPDERLRLWETGSLEQRQAALAQWRSADPGAARDALIQAWGTEPPDARVQLLGCLGVGLGLDDEAFLDAALDDRRKEVRVAAQAMLVRLPGSALRQRMQARAEPLLHVKRVLLGRNSIELTLPESIDKAAVRDGVGASAHPGLGEKAGWLVDLLTATDARLWPARLDLKPGDLLAMATRSDFAHALVRGWSTAVLRGPAPPRELGEWIHALLGSWLSAAEPMRQQYPKDFFDLFARMAPAELHACLADIVGASRSAWGQQDRVLLDLLVHAARRSSAIWPASLSREVIGRLLRELPAIPGAQWEVKAALDSFAGVVDPQAVSRLEAGWRAGAPEGGIHDSIAHFFDTVRFRHEMSLSFQEPA